MGSTGGVRIRLRLRTRVVLGVLALWLLAGGAVAGTYAAFSSTAANAGDSFAVGSVTLTDNDSGSSLMTLAGAKPYDSATSCIVVTYSGSLPSTVRLYGSTAGTGLDQYLNLTVTRGTISSPSFPSCTGFSADTTDYLGAGYGVVYSGTLQGYPTSYAAGIVDPTSGAPNTWASSEAHAYRFVVSVRDNDGVAGLNATQAFTWEARNN